MIKQSDIFLQGEGKAWLERNKDKLNIENDPVLSLIKEARIVPRRALEIGCADGWRLRELEKRYQCNVSGIDPSASRYGGDHAYIDPGTADDLGICFDADYDLVIYGFCLYLCDREDLFRIVMEGDRVLADGGHLVIYDFFPLMSHKRPYAHDTRMFSYKMHYANLWLGNPAYLPVRVSYQDGDDLPNTRTSVVILKKNLEAAWPQKSF